VFFRVDDPSQGGLLSLPELGSLRKFAVRSQGGFRIDPEHYVELTEAFLKVRVQHGLARLTAFMQLIDQVLNHSKHIPLSDEPIGMQMSEKEGSRMHSIFDYTLKNFHKDISVTDASNVVHMTPEAFCRFFKKHTRKTYVTFLNEIRIENACRKLKNGDDKLVAEIAYSCGFGNVSHFNRVFRKVTGKTPKAYQQAQLARMK
jgi:AraC-like DNA-binding protein